MRVGIVVAEADKARARAAAERAASWNRMRRCTPMHVGSWSRLERELGARLTPTARDALGLVRRAVQRGNSGIQLTTGQIAHKLGRCEASVDRSVRLLERLALVVRVPQFVTAERWSCRDGHARVNRQVANVIVLGPAGKELATPGRSCRGKSTRKRPLSGGYKLSPPKTSDHTSYDADDRSRGRRTRSAKSFAELAAHHRIGGKEPALVAPAASGQPAAPPPPPRERVTPASSVAPDEGGPASRDALSAFAALCPSLSAALGVSVTEGEGEPASAPGAACDIVTRDRDVTPVTRDRDGEVTL